jgi:hypothetical protein
MKIDAPSNALVSIPLGLARSALFSAGRIANEPDQGRRKIPIAPPRGAKLEQQGPSLRQAHALAWQAVLHWAGDAGITDDRSFSVPVDELLRLLGRKGGDSDQRARMRQLLQELTQVRIGYRTDVHHYGGPLLLDASRHSAVGPMVLRLPPELPALLTTEILRNDLARKCGLGMDSLAMWLHDYVATHIRPPPYTVDTLRMWSGSGQDLNHFRHALRQALKRLSPKGTALEPSGTVRAPPVALVLDWSIDRHDRLHIRKAPSNVKVPKTFDSPRTTRQKMEASRACEQRARVNL